MAEFINVTKKYGFDTVLENISLKFCKDKSTVIMGESGRGKTTLLRLAAGLEKPTEGEVRADGEKIAYMFQEPRLLPWKNALDNVRAPLEKSGYHLADKYFAATGLNPETDGKKYPDELSGGMQQRVAFARFLAYAEQSGADLLLLDEPFSALDEETSEKMAGLLADFSRGKTIVTVSHDESDARLLGANIIRI
ncbi:MAG: ABC transporter ATP-binding protein [Eubacteriales bacterium]